MEQKRFLIISRQRVAPTFLWGEQVTLDFITKVLECVKDSPESFEKPTSQQFYESLSKGCPQLERISWKCMKNKMRYCKKSYIEVTKWKQQTGVRMIADGDENSVVDYIQRKCPNYDELHQIFGQRKLIKFEEISCNDYDQSHITPEDASPGEESQLSFETDNSLSASCEDAIPTLEDFPEPLVSFRSIDNNMEDYEKQPKSDQTNNSVLNLIMTIQRERVLLKREKFEWQKKKEQQKAKNQRKIKQLKLEKEERLEQMKKQQELENDFILSQMELDKEERVQKFELQLRYNHKNK